MKRYYILPIVAIFLVSVFAGCANGSKSTNENSPAVSGTTGEPSAVVQRTAPEESAANTPAAFFATESLPPEDGVIGAGKGGWKRNSFICTGFDDLSGFEPHFPATGVDKIRSLPVFKDKYPTDHKTTEEMKIEIQQLVEDFLTKVGRTDLIDLGLTPNEYLWNESEISVFSCEFADFGISGRSDGFSLNLQIPNAQELGEEEWITLLQENIFLSEACAYAGIDNPGFSSRRDYSFNGDDSRKEIQIYQKCEDAKQSAVNQAFAPIYILAEANDHIVVVTRSPEAAEYVGDYEVLPYNKALNQLRKELGIQNKDVLGYKIEYQNRISTGYYVPYYKFYFKESDVQKANVPKKESDQDTPLEETKSEAPVGFTAYGEYSIRAVTDQ